MAKFFLCACICVFVFDLPTSDFWQHLPEFGKENILKHLSGANGLFFGDMYVDLSFERRRIFGNVYVDRVPSTRLFQTINEVA